jgi:hypothetical protein
MATQKEQQELIEILKFTPRTYKISMWGYGGEKVMGTVERKIYDYFKHRRLDLSEFAWGSDYADENNIPEEMWPFPPGSWYECDNMGHASGVSRNAGTLQIEDEQGNIVFQKSLEDINGWGDDEDPDPEWQCNEEVWIGSQPDGTVVFLGNSNEKGTFFEADLELKAPFDIRKLTLGYDEIDGEEIVNYVNYDGEDIDNWGGSTDGKSSDFGFYIAGSNKDGGKWEKYTNMDDIEYTMTDWFPKKIKPVREGVYMIRTPGKHSYTHQAKWTGTRWISSWQDDEPDTEEIKIKEWQGLAADPDANAVDTAFNEENFEQSIDEIEKMVTAQAGWPFAAGPVSTEDNAPKESISKVWTIKTYYKKSCEQHEYYVQRSGEGRIKVIDGFRFCEYTVETNDGEFPQIEFTTVPGGNGAVDSIDMNSISGPNIEGSELIEMFDGGCWGDVEIEGIDDEEEVERLEEFISEEGAYALEDGGDWYLNETEVWCWGPFEISDDEGNTRIVCADENGNMVDFKEE